MKADLVAAMGDPMLSATVPGAGQAQKQCYRVDVFRVTGLRLMPEQWQAVGFLAEFAQRMVVLALFEHKMPARASDLVEEVYRVADNMLDGCLKTGPKPPCKKGCFWCCYMQVRAMPLEVLRIVDFLHSSLRPKELSELQQRLAATDETTREMDSYQRVCAKMVCPLLVDGECSVYPLRPITCRVYHSLNLADCETPLDDENRSVMIRPDISGSSMGISAGLTEGLRTVGLQTRLLELVAGLRIAMENPELATRWLAGEPAFAGAEIANAKKTKGVYRALIEELGEPWNELSGEGS